MNQFLITLKQINLMKHTIGFEGNKVKRHAYKAYRNYFCAGGDMKEFQDLVIVGLAVADVRQGDTYYFLTPKGIEYLSKIVGVRIVETD